jgi:hypothetical protein
MLSCPDFLLSRGLIVYPFFQKNVSVPFVFRKCCLFIMFSPGAAGAGRRLWSSNWRFLRFFHARRTYWHDRSVIVLASRSDTVFSLSTGNQEPGTGSILLCFSSILCTEHSSVMELARAVFSELAPEGYCPRTQCCTGLIF